MLGYPPETRLNEAGSQLAIRMNMTNLNLETYETCRRGVGTGTQLEILVAVTGVEPPLDIFWCLVLLSNPLRFRVEQCFNA